MRFAAEPGRFQTISASRRASQPSKRKTQPWPFMAQITPHFKAIGIEEFFAIQTETRAAAIPLTSQVVAFAQAMRLIRLEGVAIGRSIAPFLGILTNPSPKNSHEKRE